MGKLDRTLFAAVVLLAFMVREGFILAAYCPDPLRGDSGEYMAYALNLPDYFGRGEGPDAYRSPGYPVLLWLTGSGIFQAQAILGTLTVAWTMLLGRLWLGRWSLLAGLWMALQPHHIAATGTVLSEVLFGFLLVGGLCAAAYARERRSLTLGVAAGLTFGAAYLTNPVVAFLPFLLMPLLWKDARKPALAMCAVVVLAIGGWGIRNVGMPDDSRARLNFVQGSFPEYHQAWKWQRLLMHDKYGEIVAETASGSIRPSLERMTEDPVKYLSWYASKPYLLFDWDVRIGQGGVYSVKFENSPLDRGWLLVVNALQNGLNPLLFALALCGIVLAYRGGAMVALAVVYLTAVHVVLQAEPRYAIAYRSLEVLLAFGAVAYLTATWRRMRPITADTSPRDAAIPARPDFPR